MMKNQISDMLLSILCGLALLLSARALNDVLSGFIPDDRLFGFGWSGLSPLDRLALARLLLFVPVLAVLAPLLAWPLARHASRRDFTLTLPGAACAAVLYYLLARDYVWHPFPLWLDIGRALLLFAALPVATVFWWRKRS